MHRLTVSVGCLLALSLAELHSAEGFEDSKPSAATRNSQEPWDAAEDMRSLTGQWKSAETNTRFSASPPKHAPDEEARAWKLIQQITTQDSRLILTAGRFQIATTGVQGIIRNDVNEILWRPEGNRWMNTAEPHLILQDTSGNKLRVSYVVNNDRLRFRYPANSCSRSGIILNFRREQRPEARATLP